MAYSTIPKGSLYMNTKLYTGNGSTNAITGVGFQPDWSWLKRRDTSDSHALYDAVRGVTKRLEANTTGAEATKSAGLTTFGTDGFTLGNDTQANANSGTYASWNWKANGAGSANTAGSINSTVSVNTTSGFSIVSWTGNGSPSTIGHGLGAAPELIILKNRTGVYGWQTYWKVLGSNKYLSLNSTDAVVTSTESWNNTAPTSTVFSVDGDSNNNNAQNIIAYCFKEKKGYSKFGTYQGNNNADGTFVYTGFKPAWLMVFAYQAGNENWIMVDNKRDGFNVENEQLFPNTSGAEESNDEVDLLSNGFKLRRANTRMNGSIPYIYMTFAENPFVATSGSKGVPVTAR